ncbi:hypothetical protein P8452_73782 [Trifolium repens]|nr:hypothetical protein P8452_73782 [Trifolium repens]
MTSSQTGIVCNDSSTHSVTVPFQKYDVFISFRGEDTRNSFTSHLHAALSRSSIRTYIDYKIDKGKEVWAELLKAIKRSTLFLVVFSKNYASSTNIQNLHRIPYGLEKELSSRQNPPN